MKFRFLGKTVFKKARTLYPPHGSLISQWLWLKLITAQLHCSMKGATAFYMQQSHQHQQPQITSVTHSMIHFLTAPAAQEAHLSVSGWVGLFKACTFAKRAICNTCNSQYVQFAICAIWNRYNLEKGQFGAYVICHTCNLQHMQLATPNYFGFIDFFKV